MTSRSPFTFRHVIESRHRRSTSERSLETFPPERYSGLVRRQGGLISVPRNLISAKQKNESSSKRVLTKLLLNVNIERSLGPVHVILSPENTVKDLVKSAIDIYVKERRRPLLEQIDPDRFELHYSQFSLESKFWLRVYFLFSCFRDFYFYFLRHSSGFVILWLLKISFMVNWPEI